MFRISKKPFYAVMIVLVLMLGMGSAPKTMASSDGQEDHPGLPKQVDAATLITNKGSLELSSKFTDAVKGAQERDNEINAYQVDLTKVTIDSEYDKDFIDDAVTSNSLELWTMLFSLPYIRDPDLCNLVRMMVAMHTSDQKIIVQMATQLGESTTADFVNASVYPETPDWDLGMRTEDLRMDYLDPLIEPAKENFSERVQSILESEHTSDVQSETTALRMIKNPELKAFAKHSSDVTELHLLLLDVVHAYMQQYDEPPSADLTEPYMDPHMYTVNGQSTTGGKP